ncbi:FtsQ-type POTRA domain-containing protein [Brucepastera parasyntrophica]|uniref:cell division protein FtsQ/DivIB n=1 Tax=Brucepastera parasyntrophica TaxID=2880008 RepID=UPI00210E2126|nr:FtsQ-type POTRA domain-containing protein [Brucepastera parasyntrophica]ULQ60169.1 FtsQ-type POTRA domain-containing protein [Brucepastera parasyntrophica]
MPQSIAIDRSKQSTDTWKSLLLKIVIVLLAIFLVFELAFYLVIIPTTSVVRITVSGAPSIGYDEICYMANISGKEKWLDFNAAIVSSRLAANPLFESVAVEKKFPDRVVINLQERTPVAIAFGEKKGRTVPVEIDKNGIAFRVGHIPADSHLPILTGLTFEEVIPGMRLHAQLKPLLTQLHHIESKNPALLSSISEIKIDQKTYGGYDLVMYPVNNQIRVRTDKALNEESLQYMMLVLDVVQDLALDIEEIDIRAGTAAYRLKHN